MEGVIIITTKEIAFKVSIEARREALEARYPIWRRDTVAEHFEKACKEYVNRPYMYIHNKSYTYEAIWDMGVTYAKALMNLGVKRREHIATYMENDASFPALMIASSMVGAVFIPINSMLKKDELKYIISQSDTNYLFVKQSEKNKKQLDIVSDLLDDSEIQEYSRLEKVICLLNEKETITDARFLDGNTFLTDGGAISMSELDARFEESRYPDEVAIIMYTSGSTGSPKGVMLTHDNLLRAGYGTTLSRAIEDGRVTFAPLPFYHCYAIIEAIFSLSFVGGSFISAQGMAPLESMQLMEKFKVNDYLCVPTTLLPVLNHPKVKEFDFSNLFAMWIGGAAAPIQVWKQAVEIFELTEIITGYGQTEVASSGVTTELGDSLETITTRVGRPKIHGVSALSEFNDSAVQYVTVDPETGESLPKGAIGELVVRGATVTCGYYNKPKETAKTIDKDGWLRTGDVGRIDEKGYLQILGRSKEMYKVSGELVSPREIEIVISEHPAVSQVNVIGVPDLRTSEIGAAFIELKDGQTLTRKEIIDWCAPKLAKFKMPRHVWFVKSAEWPMTGTGKVQKFRLQELAKEKLTR